MSAGLYVPLQANFFGDDKVVLCSPLAKLVYLQGLCIAKLMGTDGIVTRAQLKRECDRVQHIDRHIAELVSVGLWTEVSLPDVNTASIHGQERVNTAYATNAWLKHNKSREWIEAYRTARAEDGKRGGRPPKSSPAPDDGPKGNPFESEKGNPFENPENEKGTENLEGRQREERGKTESKTATAPGPVPADNSREDDPRLVAVVGLLAKRETANASGVRNPGGYEHDARKRIQTERGNEIRALLRDRPSASVETIVDLLERDRGYHVTVNGAVVPPAGTATLTQPPDKPRSNNQSPWRRDPEATAKKIDRKVDECVEFGMFDGIPEPVREAWVDHPAPLPPELMARARHQEDEQLEEAVAS